MSFTPVIARTNGVGAPLFRCPRCQATSDKFPIQVDASKGLMECHAVRDQSIAGFHSLPHVDKTANFIITYV